MAVELHASVKSFLVSTGMVTQADADAKGTDVLADLPIMDAVAVYGMIEAAKKRADLEVQKEALLVTAGQMQLNNKSIENWRERAAIAASRTWPTDQATIDELIRELDKDTAPPALPPDPPTTQGEAADKADKDIDKDIDDSRTQNKKIRAILDRVATSTSKAEFPEDRKLAQSFSAWLERHGVETSQSHNMVSFDGTNYFEKSKFTSVFPRLNMPLAVRTPAVGGQSPYVYTMFNASPWMQPFPAGFPSDYPELFPDNLGYDHDNNSSTNSIWSDGVNFYEVDIRQGDDVGHDKWWIDFVSRNAQNIVNAQLEGTPHTAFTSGGPLIKRDPTDSYISNPSPDQRSAWSAHFDGQVDKLNANNNLWGAQAASQQVRMQEAVSVYGTYLHSMSSVIQKRDKAYEQSMPR